MTKRKNTWQPHAVRVTQPFMPPLEEFIPYLEQIWKNKHLTNNGPLHQRLEAELVDYLKVGHVSLFTNGTVALITALQALGVQGEVITTPYSFVATSHSLIWNRMTPVFCDIDEQTLSLDPARVERAITERTTAIMPVHCYGYPGDLEAIQKIASKHGLKVIYDAAHAFGVGYRGTSLLNFGDLSVVSFHATKVFNTFEGGAIISHDPETKKHIDNLKNFGIINETMTVEPGINGKMSEVNAAMGLLQLSYMPHILEQRRARDRYYRESLAGLEHIQCLSPPPGTDNYNYSYFPILVKEGFRLGRDALYEKMREHDIFARRYFYPLISDFPTYNNLPSAQRSNLPVAARIADQVLCLPLFPELDYDEIDAVVGLIRASA